jgi:dTDP-4-amino-4,6-dideoxygalactose transaminase
MPAIALNDLSRAGAEKSAVQDALLRVVDRGWYVHGPELEAFEREFAAYCGVAHGVGVANGTDAIELGLRGIGISAGDEVVVAANAAFYAVTALNAIGATPAFADVDDTHLLLDPASVEAAMTPRTKAVVVTHLYGRMADMPRFRELADRHAIKLFEDCAQSHGARKNGRFAGSWGDAASFSFYPTKNLGALGDGGLVATNNAEIATRVKRLRQYGWDKKYVVVDAPARNSRLDEVQAAVLRTKLPLLDGYNARRRTIAARYAAVRHQRIRHPVAHGEDYVAHLYVLRTDARDDLRRHLSAHGIASDVHYPLLDTQQPILQSTPSAKTKLPVSERAVQEILTLPCYPELTDDEVARVCNALATWES